MFRTYIYAALTGAALSLGLWIPALLITKGVMDPLLFLNGYPGRLHSEQIAALFILPMVAGFRADAGLSGSHIGERDFYRVHLPYFIAMALLSLFANPLWFHLTFAVALGYTGWEALRRLSPRTLGSDLDDLFTASILTGLAGIGFWILADLTRYGSLYTLGKSLLFYGFINLPALAIFIRSSGTEERHGIRRSLLLYLFSYVIEMVSYFAFPLPGLIPAGLRGAITLWWIGLLIRPFRNPEKSAQFAFRILFSLFYAVGMIGYAVSKESGTHHAHYFFAAAVLPLLLQAAGGRISPGSMRSKIGIAVIGLVLMAGLTRATAKHLDDIFRTGIILNTHLAYASLLFLMALPVYLFLLRRRGKGESDI